MTHQTYSSTNMTIQYHPNNPIYIYITQDTSLGLIKPQEPQEPQEHKPEQKPHTKPLGIGTRTLELTD